MTGTTDLSREATGCAAIGTRDQRKKPSTERSLDGKCLLALEATNAGTVAARILDQRDADIVAERIALFDAQRGPRVGDYVVFADGVERRISYHWRNDEGWDGGLQTSDGGRWYFGPSGRCDFSGSLHPRVPADTLTQREEAREGSAWIFHHDGHWAHNGVDFVIPFRVFDCSQEAPR